MITPSISYHAFNQIHHQLIAMKKFELVFVPMNLSSHLTSAIALAKLLLDQDERLSITFIVILFPYQTDLDLHTKSLTDSDTRIRFTFINNSSTNPPPSLLPSSQISLQKFVTLYFDSHVSHVEEEVTKLISSEDDSIQLVGFVLDMFSTSMIDVANKFNVPSYIFFSTNIAFLGFFLDLPVRHSQVGKEFHLSDQDPCFSGYQNPVPIDVIPEAAFDKTGGGYEAYLRHATRFQESKGIIVNSFAELEPYAVNSIGSHKPTIYPVGPLLSHGYESTDSTKIMTWLDNQPSKTVLFLCFGNLGSFSQPQIEQMAMALEKSGHRFLWSLRQPPPKGTNGPPTEYTDLEKDLPEGFLGRVKDRGMVCGWAPQVQILAHEAVKGFVSHCGWNSVLESFWYGVPIATWPLYAEQQMNAFLLVRELGLAVELSLTYKRGQSEVVMADQIEKAVNLLMEDENPVRERVMEISEKGRKALMNGGSSLITVEKLVGDMIHNIGEK